MRERAVQKESAFRCSEILRTDFSEADLQECGTRLSADLHLFEAVDLD